MSRGVILQQVFFLGLGVFASNHGAKCTTHCAPTSSAVQKRSQGHLVWLQFQASHPHMKSEEWAVEVGGGVEYFSICGELKVLVLEL